MNNLISFFAWFNNDVLALPTTVLFLGTGIFFTLRLGFIQFKAFKHFFHMVADGIQRKKTVQGQQNLDTMSSFGALFTAMATSIGTGTVVAPAVAIIAGGPGALFWLVVYLFFASSIKFVEVMFAFATREVHGAEKKLVGGPMQYLKLVHPLLARWYGGIMLLLYFFGWQTVQSNTLANMLAQELVPYWLVGLILALFVFATLQGGARRIGALASKLVPFMFCLYVSCALFILLSDFALLRQAIGLVYDSVTQPSSCASGLGVGAVLHAMRAGVYNGIFISEAGLGTSSIAHAMADTKKAYDQGVLAMYSTVADITLSLISGFLVLVSGLWMLPGARATIVYDVFKIHAPYGGDVVLLASICLFVLTTVMGNAFNGMQIYATFTQFRAMRWYMAGVSLVVFLGALMPIPLVWEMMNTLLALAAIPNVIGLLILSVTHGSTLQE